MVDASLSFRHRSTTSVFRYLWHSSSFAMRLSSILRLMSSVTRLSRSSRTPKSSGSHNNPAALSSPFGKC